MTYLKEAEDFVSMLRVSYGRDVISPLGITKDIVKALARWKATSHEHSGPAAAQATEIVDILFMLDGPHPIIAKESLVAAITKQLEEKLELREELKKASHRIPLVTAVLFTNDAGQVLLGRRKNNSGEGYYSTPGGLVEQHENVLTCAEREVLEETGYDRIRKSDLRIIAWREHHRFGKHYVVCYLHHQYRGGDIFNREPYKCEGWEWKDIGDLNVSNCMEPQDVLAILRRPVPTVKEFWTMWAPGNMWRTSKSNGALATAFAQDYLEMYQQAQGLITQLKEPTS